MKNIKLKNVLFNLLGSLILALAIYNIHSISDVMEGGVIGLTLLFQHWLGITPAITNLILTALCYFLGYRQLGKPFIIYSAIACISYSVFYAIIEQFPRIYPDIANNPILAAILGGILIGIGAGICVRNGGAQSGDDALAMTLSSKFKINIVLIYLISDLTVLALSLTYLPITKIVYSLLTVIISGLVLGVITKLKFK